MTVEFFGRSTETRKICYLHKATHQLNNKKRFKFSPIEFITDLTEYTLHLIISLRCHRNSVMDVYFKLLQSTLNEIQNFNI